MANARDLEEHAERVVDQARNDLTRFQYPKLIEVLRHSPEGVPLSALAGVYDRGVHLVDPFVVAASALKQSPAVLFSIEGQLYLLATGGHRTAFAEM